MGARSVRIAAAIICMSVAVACIALIPLGRVPVPWFRHGGGGTTRANAADLLRSLVNADSKLPKQAFYRLYVAGRPILINASELKPLLGARAEFIHILTYVRGKGWVNVPVRIYSRCVTVNNGAAEYCILPQRIGRDVKIVVKAPPSTPNATPPQPPEWVGAAGRVTSAYRLSVTVRYSSRVFVLHYVVVVGSAPNPWVVKEQSRFKSIEDGFDGWGIEGFVSRVVRAVRSGVIREGAAQALIKYYASSPLRCLRISITPLKLSHASTRYSAASPPVAGMNASGLTYVIELVQPPEAPHVWAVNGSLTAGNLTLTATYRLEPQEGRDVIRDLATVSLTPTILVLRRSSSGFARVTVTFCRGGEPVASESYVMYEGYGILRPTLYWPSHGVVAIRVSLSGQGSWLASIAGLSVVHLVKEASIVGTVLRKELRLYVLGSPGGEGAWTTLRIPPGTESGAALAYLPAPSDLALVGRLFFNKGRSVRLSFTVRNLGTADAYVTVCFASRCSAGTLVRGGQAEDVSIGNVSALTVNLYYWFHEPVPVAVLVRKAAGSGTAVISVRPDAVLTLFARPLRPAFYGGVYTDSTLYRDSCAGAWNSWQEFRGGFVAAYAGYVGRDGVSATLIGWFGTNSEGFVGPGRNFINVRAELTFLEMAGTNSRYGLVKLGLTLSGPGVSAGRPAVLAFSKGSPAPELPEIPPPPALIAGLVSPSAGLEVLGSASTTHDVVSWVWNALSGYARNYVEVGEGAGGVRYVWVHGPQAPVAKYVILDVEDDDVGLYVPATIGASVNAVAGATCGQHMLTNLSLSATIRVAGTPS